MTTGDEKTHNHRLLRRRDTGSAEPQRFWSHLLPTSLFTLSVDDYDRRLSTRNHAEFHGRTLPAISATRSNLLTVTPGGHESELASTNGPPAASRMTDRT